MGRDVEVLEQGTGRTSQQVVKRAEQMMQKSTSPIARHSLHNLPCICFVYIQLPKQAEAPRSPVSAVDLVGGPAERVDHLAAVLGGAGRNLVAHVDVRRKGALQQLLVGARDDGSELVVGERLVELSDVVRDVLLVPVVDVAGGADLELVLGGVYALGEGHLGAFGGLQERTTNRFVNNNVTRFKTRVCVRLLLVFGTTTTTNCRHGCSFSVFSVQQFAQVGVGWSVVARVYLPECQVGLYACRRLNRFSVCGTTRNFCRRERSKHGRQQKTADNIGTRENTNNVHLSPAT